MRLTGRKIMNKPTGITPPPTITLTLDLPAARLTLGALRSRQRAIGEGRAGFLVVKGLADWLEVEILVIEQAVDAGASDGTSVVSAGKTAGHKSASQHL